MSIVKANNWTDSNGEAYNTILQLAEGTSTTTFSVTNPNGVYSETPLNVTITTKRANSRFYIICSQQCYSTTFNNGWNIAFTRKIGSGADVFIAGRSGSAGGGGDSDTWMGFGHSGGPSSSSWTRTRTAFDEPAQPAGTSLTYKLWFGGWTTAGQGWSHYPGYNQTSRIHVMEIAA
jgi:hypothetical protein